MSKESKTTADKTVEFAESVGLEAVSLSVAKQVVQLCWHDGHVPLLIGESAVGKTHGMNQLARLNQMKMIPFHLGNVDSSNIRGPAFPQQDGTFKYLPPGHVPIKWEPSTRQRRILHSLESRGIGLEDVLKDELDLDTLELPDKDLDVIFEIREGFKKQNQKAVLFFDELNRGSKDAMNAVMSVWAEKLLGGAELGPNVRIAAAMNPPGGSYAVNSQISTDPAMRRRLCQVVVQFSPSEFLRFIEDPARQVEDQKIPPIDFEEIHSRPELRPWHYSVISFLRQNPGLQLDHQRRESGQVYPCPASWESVSDTMYTIERLELNLSDVVVARAVKIKLAGHVGAYVAGEFLHFYQTDAEVIDPVEVIKEYQPGKPIWTKVQRKLNQGEFLSLMNVLEASIKYLMDPEKRDLTFEEAAPQLGHLFNDIPANCAQDLLVHVRSVCNEIHGGYHDDLRDLLKHLNKDPNFTQYRKRALEAAASHVNS